MFHVYDAAPDELVFVSRNLFQVLWRFRTLQRSEAQLDEGQAIVAFCLDPRSGHQFLQRAIWQGEEKGDGAVGEWLASVRRGIDSRVLGSYFSRQESLVPLAAFLNQLDLRGSLVSALRETFSAFKPTGESQVIDRILGVVAQVYWDQCGGDSGFSSAEAIHKAAFSALIVNTDLHVACKVKHGAPPMTEDEYLRNARSVLSSDEASDSVLRQVYKEVKHREIAVTAVDGLSFKELPTPPDMEGWLVVQFRPGVVRRAWVVCALQRLFFFGDGDDTSPRLVMDLSGCQVASGISAGDRVQALRSSASLSSRFFGGPPAPSREELSTMFVLCGGVMLASESVVALERSAPRINGPSGSVFADSAARAGALSAAAVLAAASAADQLAEAMVGSDQGWSDDFARSCVKPGSELLITAESSGLVDKWVQIIAEGPL